MYRSLEKKRKKKIPNSNRAVNRLNPPGKPVTNRTEGAFEFKFKFDRLPVNRTGKPEPEAGGLG
jgi:hypothetical protein